MSKKIEITLKRDEWQRVLDCLNNDKRMMISFAAELIEGKIYASKEDHELTVEEYTQKYGCEE